MKTISKGLLTDGMLVVKIFEGLGNQLFQYAFARALSLRHKVEFKLDITYFDLYSHHRKYGLNKFNITEHIASPEEIYNVSHGIKKNRIKNFFFQSYKKTLPYYKQPYVKEDLTKFDPKLLLIDSDTYLDGYFTGEIFFKDFEAQIRKDFQLKAASGKENAGLIEKIKKQNSVCITIRRGDFINHPLLDVCTLDYFYDAHRLMCEKLDNPVFYIFSDDNDWARKNFIIAGEHYFITHNYPDFYEDFRIVQSCRHHIIPNSTFSWWGAWLSDNKSKIVIAPEVWLNSSELDYSYFLPKEWIKLQNKF